MEYVNSWIANGSYYISEWRVWFFWVNTCMCVINGFFSSIWGSFLNLVSNLVRGSF